MRDDWLEDGDVALLARQAVDLLAADIEVDIVPGVKSDPYRWGGRGGASWQVFPRVDGRRGFSITVEAGMSPAEALAQLVGGLSANVGATTRLSGLAFPPCPGHTHAARVRPAGEQVALVCPETGDEVGRLQPESAG